MVDWWELMQAQPSFLFNGEDLTHNNQQSFKKSLTSTPLSNIHQKMFCHKVLTYKGAMLQYSTGSALSGHELCPWGW